MARKKKDPMQEQRDAVIKSMQPLVLIPEFEKFIETIREMKDNSVRWWIDSESVKNERESLAAKGEIRAYLWLLEMHAAQKEQLEEQARLAQEAAQNGQG